MTSAKRPSPRAVPLAISDATLDPFRALVAGVAAAPQAVNPKAWLELLPPCTNRRLKLALLALEAKIRSDASKGEELPVAARVALLREEMARLKFQGLIVPHPDRQQCEYTPIHDERLAWLTGFDGSAGMAIVLEQTALVTSDSRYDVKLPQQTDSSVFQVVIAQPEDNPGAVWLRKHLPAGATVGFDPWLHTPDQIKPLREAVEAAGGKLVACPVNLVDSVWANQPAEPISPIVPQPIEYAGKGWREKVESLAAKLVKDKVEAVVLTGAASIAWLLNIRGGDVAHTPLPLGFAVVFNDGEVALFCDLRKVSRKLKSHFGQDVRIQPFEEFATLLRTLGRMNLRIQVDPGSAACFVFDRLTAGGAEIVEATDPCLLPLPKARKTAVEIVQAVDPCILPKACKNGVEIAGARNCHIRDGAALTKALFWLKVQSEKGATLTELDVVARVNAERRKLGLFRDLSFKTIVGAGANGADVHYEPTRAKHSRLTLGQMVLIDSGGQYLDGTTDVTRTIAFGASTETMRRHFTLVLKGMIALTVMRFPEGTTGQLLDSFAHQFLWQAGLDFGHGTGHGVGSYLGVHEGPQGINSRFAPGRELKPGMIISNEPGFYKKDSHGIRIENLVLVRPPMDIPGGEIPMMSFETLTLAPIDLDLVDVSLLTPEEREWLNAYHARVYRELAPLVPGATEVWLRQATRAI